MDEAAPAGPEGAGTAPAAAGAGSAAPARIVFFGSGSFALALLDALLADPATAPIAVISTPDRPAGRAGTLMPTPVTARAREAGVDLRQPATLRDAAAVEMLGGLAPDVAVVADYGRMVPPALLEVPRRGFLNVHPSLLPRHRGATPIPAAIAVGDAETGVTVIAMDAGMDTGPIVAASRRTLDGTEDGPGLEAALARDGAALLGATLGPWLNGSLAAAPQGEDGATLTRPLRREDGRLDPARPAQELERQVRAYRPWPGTFVETDAGRLIVLEAEVAPGAGAGPETVSGVGVGPAPGTGAGAEPGTAAAEEPGTVVRVGDGIALATSNGLLRLVRVQLAGGRAMSAADLLRGRPALVGSRAIGRVRESGPS